MPAVTILHLSDLHALAGRGTEITPVAVSACVNERERSALPVLVLVTGDITHKGSVEGYAAVGQFLDGLLRELRSTRSPGEVALAHVPGNHDINEDHNGEERKALLRSLASGEEEWSSSHIGVCTSAQKEYMAFSKGLGALTVSDDEFAAAHVLQFGDTSVAITVLNTALADRCGQKGVIPTAPAWAAPASNSGQADVCLALMHHPPSWFQGSDAERLLRFLNSNHDVVLLGHGHVAEHVTVSSSTAGRDTLLTKGCVFSHPSEQASEFSVLVVENIASSVRVRMDSFGLPSGAAMYMPVSEGNWELQRPTDGFSLRSAFLRELEQLGARIQHPVDPDLGLSDIYVYPTMNVLRISDVPEVGRLFDLRSGLQVPSLVREARHLHVAGGHHSGKTSLLRQLYLDLFREGYVPVLVSGANLKETDPERVRRAAIEAFRSQYSDHVQDVERYVQLPENRKAILIDDLESSTLSGRPALKARLLDRVREQFGVSVVTDSSTVLSILSGASDSQTQSIPQYTCCELMPFSPSLRAQLIEKWVSRGGESAIADDQSSFLRKIDELERSVNEVLGRRAYPESPFVVLAVLHFLDKGATVQLTEGSLASLYRMLVEEELAHPKYGSNVDALRGFLGGIAFHMHQKGEGAVSHVEMDSIHREFEQDTDVALDLESSLRQLSRAWILECKGDMYEFRYPLAYAFFLSHFIASRVHRNEDKEHMASEIRSLCSDLGSVRNLSTLQFLAQSLQEDPVFTAPLLEITDALFRDVQVLDLEAESGFVNGLVAKAPEYTLSAERDPMAARRRKREVMEQLQSAAEEKGEDEATIDSLKCSNAIQLLGQLVRHNPATFSSRFKRAALTSAYSLALRFLADYYRATRKFVEESLATAGELASTDEERSAVSQIQSELSHKLFGLTVFITVAILTHVAESVGSSNLRRSFDAIRDNEPQVSFAFLDTAVRLGSFSTFPISQIKSLSEQIKDDHLCRSVLAVLAMIRLHYYPEELDHALESQLCQELGIKRDFLRRFAFERREQDVSGRQGSEGEERGTESGE